MTDRDSAAEELYRTLGGSVADTADAITGLPGLATRGVNALLKTKLREIKGTNFGSKVPQPWATGNQIIREVSPFMFGGGEAEAATGIAPRAARVVGSVMDKPANPSRRELLNLGGTVIPADAIGPSHLEKAAELANTPITRRGVNKGIAAAATIAATGGGKVNDLLKSAPKAAEAVAPVAKAVETPFALHKSAILTHSEAIDAHQQAIRLLKGKAPLNEVEKVQNDALNKTMKANEDSAAHPDYKEVDPEDEDSPLFYSADAEQAAANAPSSLADEGGPEQAIADHENAINSHLEAIDTHDRAAKNLAQQEKELNGLRLVPLDQFQVTGEKNLGTLAKYVADLEIAAPKRPEFQNAVTNARQRYFSLAKEAGMTPARAKEYLKNKAKGWE